jgi:threonine dehydratase
MDDWRAFLAELAYPHCEETHNPAYRLFLGQQSQPLPPLGDLVSAGSLR